MVLYIFKRLLWAVFTLLVILTLAFFVVRFMPGNVYDDPDLSQEIVDILNERAGLDRPLWEQYFTFLGGIVFDGYWGTSLKVEPGVPAFTVLASRIPVSLTLNFLAMAVAIPIGLCAGVVSATNRTKAVGTVIPITSILFISVPSFVMAALLQYTFAYNLGWLPILYEPSAVGADKFLSMLLPMTALALGPIATVTRYLRGELAELSGSEYVLQARLKGLSVTVATLTHSLKNALIPMLTILIPMFAQILGGSMVIERIFSIPGVGGILIKSISLNDHQLTVAALMFYALISIIATLLVDISYALVDPRVRLGGGRD